MTMSWSPWQSETNSIGSTGHDIPVVFMGVSGCFQKYWYPQIIHFNRVFHYKPSSLGYPYFWKHPSSIMEYYIQYTVHWLPHKQLNRLLATRCLVSSLFVFICILFAGVHDLCLYSFGAAQACSSGVREKMLSKHKLIEASTLKGALMAKCRTGTYRNNLQFLRLTNDAISMQGDKKRRHRHLKNRKQLCLLAVTCLSGIFRNLSPKWRLLRKLLSLMFCEWVIWTSIMWKISLVFAKLSCMFSAFINVL